MIGTQWEIDAAHAAAIAHTFYKNLGPDRLSLDASRAAHALHAAIKKSRDKFPRNPYLWAAYMHAGA